MTTGNFKIFKPLGIIKYICLLFIIIFIIGKIVYIGVLLMKIKFGNLNLMDLEPYHLILMMYTL